MIDLKYEILYYKNQKLKIDDLKLKYKIKDISLKFVSPSIDLIDRYKYFLLSQSKYTKVKSGWYMRPDYASYDEYDTPNLDYIIMYLNDCFTPEDFVMTNIYIPSKTAILKIVEDNILNNNFDLIEVSFDDTDLTTIQNKLLIETAGKLISGYFQTQEDYSEVINFN